MTPETARAVRELADDMGCTPDEVIAKAVTALAILRATLWTPSPVKNTRESE